MTEYIASRLSSIRIRDLVDILIVAVLVYNLIKILRGTRAEQLSKGIIFILVLTQISESLELYTINWILSHLITLGMVAILIVFQPELRRGLEFIGRSSSIRKGMGLGTKRTNAMAAEIASAVGSLSRQKIGALIVIERQTGLSEIADTGTSLDAFISSGLLINIFIPNTPLHDGAVIIRGDRIVAAACFLPLTDNRNLAKDLGTRHRAAIGMSERSDSLSIIVSEETGAISTAENGKISRHIDLTTLEYILDQVYEPKVQRFENLMDKIGGTDNEGKD